MNQILYKYIKYIFLTAEAIGNFTTEEPPPTTAGPTTTTTKRDSFPNSFDMDHEKPHGADHNEVSENDANLFDVSEGEESGGGTGQSKVDEGTSKKSLY